MKCTEFAVMLDRIVPLELAEEYDNVGLLIGTNREIRHVLVALDCSTAVAEEAIRIDADLVLTHHPLFFHPIHRILPDDPDTAPAYLLIQHGIGLYSAHTNLDACAGGVNDALADTLDLADVSCTESNRFARIGNLLQPMTLSEFVKHCETRLHTKARFVGEPDCVLRRVGVIGGAGGDMADDMLQAKCDVFVTGEMKHHEAIRAAALGLPCVVAGHYETESVVLKKWITRLQNEENDVQYTLTGSETSPLTTL